jgi:hypothetical protein
MLVLDDRTGSGWLKAKQGQVEGLVPRNYVAPHDPTGLLVIEK